MRRHYQLCWKQALLEGKTIYRILRTINNEIIPVIQPIRPLNISLPQVYPFASDKIFILTLEEQMNIQKNNVRKTEKTGSYISQIHLNATKPLFIVLTFVLVIPIFIIFIIICLIYRHHPNYNNSSTAAVNDSTTKHHLNRSTSNAVRDSSGSIYDLLMAFAKNKADKTSTNIINQHVNCRTLNIFY